MFKIATRRQFTHTVEFKVPVDGGFENASFKARFQVLSSDEAAEFKVATLDGMKSFLATVVIELEDVTDDAGKPLPYSDALRDQVIDFQPARIALYAAYWAALTPARTGN